MKQYLTPLHFSISVKDIDESIAWYKEHLHFDLVFKMHIEASNAYLAFVRHGQFEIELLQYDGSTSNTFEHINSQEDQKTRGAKHLAFLVENVDDLHNRLKSENVEISLEPVVRENKEAGVREKIFFIRDLDNVRLEFVERL